MIQAAQDEESKYDVQPVSNAEIKINQEIKINAEMLHVESTDFASASYREPGVQIFTATNLQILISTELIQQSMFRTREQAFND